ncbi:MAG TPA: hypothetical protein VI521_00285, partial [Candidatus Babeliales bacterium]|nr:hypothetical protein [Candidatus Babeliales bacterium]
MKKRLLLLVIIFVVCAHALITRAVNAPSQSFVQRQLDKLAQSRAVKEIVIFKDLPGAITRCYISKKNCTQTDMKVVSQALIRIPIIMAAFAVATGIVFLKVKKDNRIPFEQLKEDSKRTLQEQMVTAVTKNQKNYLVDIFTKVRFPQNMLNTYLSLAVPSAESDIVALLL